MIKQLMVCTLVLLAIVNCSDNDAIQPEEYKEEFVGKWTITRVDHDGITIDEWTGSHLTIEQRKADRGIYVMNDTKYDSIWSSNGTWKRSTQNHELILDDTLTVDILVDVERLKIVKWLPWTGQSTCYEGVCLPIVTGIWTFEFEKAK